MSAPRFLRNSAVDCRARTIWIIDAHRDGQRFVARADEKLTAFLELESQARDSLVGFHEEAVWGQ